MDFDFLPSNLQIAYPFQLNVTVTRHGAGTQIGPIVAAAQIRTRDTRADESLTLEALNLESADNFATITASEIKLTWATSGDSLWITGTQYTTVQVYGNWLAVEWYATEAQMTEGVTTAIKMVFPTSAIELDLGTYYMTIGKDTDDITFHSSLIKQGPNELQRVYWKHGDTLDLVADRGDPLIIRAGFNMSIAQEDDEEEGFQAETFTAAAGRPPTRIAIDAVPGAGRGKYLLCPGTLYLLTLNGVGPSRQGDVQLKPLDCYWLERAIAGELVSADGTHGITQNATLEANELRIKNGCGPCCSCEAYIDTYLHLQGIWDQAKTVSSQIFALRDTLTALIATYEARNQPETVAISIEDSETITVIAAYANLSSDIVNPSTDWASDPLTFTFNFTPLTGRTLAYVTGSGRVANSGSQTLAIDPDMSTDWVPKVEIDSMEVSPYTVLFWTGQFTASGDLTGETVEVTVLTSGSNAESNSGSASISV